MPQPNLSDNPVSPDTAREHGIPLYRIRRTPNVVRTLLVELVRELYRAGNSLFPEYAYHYEPALGQNVVGGSSSEDCPDDSGIPVWINSSLVWDDQGSDFRPAIFVRMDPFTYSSLLGEGLSSVVGATAETGEFHHARLVKGAATVVHVGDTMAQADDMLANTLDLIDAFSDIIRDDFCFDRFSVLSVRPPTLSKEEDTEKLQASLRLGFQFKDRWTIRQEAPILRKAVFRSRLNALDALDLLQ